VSSHIETETLAETAEAFRDVAFSARSMPKAAAPPSCHGLANDDYVRCTLGHLALGQIAFDPPQEMEYRKASQITVRISRSGADATIRQGMGDNVPVQTEHLRVGDRMSVKLHGPGFAITTQDGETQFIPPTGFASWHFDVTPTEYGEQVLILEAKVHVKTDKSEDDEVLPAIKRPIHVRVTIPGWIGARFDDAGGWKWFIGLMIGGLGYLGKRWLDRNKAST
jgi:hypothetical protein